MAHDVFICHSSKDKTTADAMCAVLEARGLRCWIAPRDIRAGADWSEAILDGISQARVLVLVFSSNANASQQVKREIERAVHKGIVVIPFRIEDVLPARALEYYLSTPHWLDAFTPPLERHLNVLANQIAALVDAGRAGQGAAPAAHPAAPAATTAKWPLAQWHVPRGKTAWLIAGGASLLLVALVAAAMIPWNSPPPQWRQVSLAADMSVGDRVIADGVLHQQGIAISGRVPETVRVYLQRQDHLYDGTYAILPATANVMSACDDTGLPPSYTIVFADPVTAVRLTRPALYRDTKSGVTHAAWNAQALNAEGQAIEGEQIAQEPLLRGLSDADCAGGHPPGTTCSDIPARSFELRAKDGEPIYSVRIHGDNRRNGNPFAASCSLIISKLEYVPYGGGS